MHTTVPLLFERSPAEFLKKAIAVARASGFRHIEEAKSASASVERKAPLSFDSKGRRYDSLGGELANALRGCAERGLIPGSEPSLVYHFSSATGSPGRISFGLHILGSKNSISEALILKTAFGIIEEAGIKGATLHVNSIGDRDSSAKFAREATNYLKRHLDRVPGNVLDTMREDVFSALELLARKRNPLFDEIPRPMEFLTSASRRHLREVLEFIERNGIPYEIDELLIGHRDCYQQTVFEVRGPLNDDEEVRPIVARGGRYDEYPRRLMKIQSPGVGIVFSLALSGSAAVKEPPLPKRPSEPKVCFIHVGFEAKVKSLMVIDAFRRARVPFYQCLKHERLTDQMRYAESLSVPYTMIMGQKEALEDSVIFRDVATRAQESVPINSLASFFKSRAF